jgi:catechol 2,3-dioxygenase
MQQQVMQQQIKTAETSPVLESHRGPMHIGMVALRVRDVERVAQFYEDVIGLSPMAAGPDGALLGNDGVPLLRLDRDETASRAPRGAPGLFHTAFVLPQRADLGLWLATAVANRWRVEGAADHLVSEAIYLSDPEGNGIEIYRDRPAAEWPHEGDRVHMSNEPLDVDGLLRLAQGNRPGQTYRMPRGARIGHVHLKVADLPEARAVISDRWGIPEMCLFPGAAFFGAGGYHHHLATNVWSADGRPVAGGPWLGLKELTLQATDRAFYEAVAEQWRAAGGRTDGEGVAIESLGIAFALRPPQA